MRGALALRTQAMISDFVVLELLTTFGKKRREGVVSRPGLASLVARLHRDSPTFYLLPVEAPVRRDAMELAEKHFDRTVGPLDLLHLASARHAARLATPLPLVFFSSDRPLLDVARAEGLATYNPETEPHGVLRSALGVNRFRD